MKPLPKCTFATNKHSLSIDYGAHSAMAAVLTGTVLPSVHSCTFPFELKV